MGSQRVGHDWGTELNLTVYMSIPTFQSISSLLITISSFSKTASLFSFCFVNKLIYNIYIYNFRLHIWNIIWYLSFSVWLTSLSMIISMSTHDAITGIIAFFLIVQWYSIVYMNHIFFIHFSINGHLGWYHVWLL